MNTILIPTDFSDAAKNAMRYAVQLFGLETQYVMINSYVEPRSTTSSMISLREVLHEASVAGIEEETNWAKQEFPAIRLQTLCEYGEPDQAIASAARLHKADMIVMGTTGATGLKEVMLGSVAASVIRIADRPVIAVPAYYRIRDPKKVLFATDLKIEKQLPDQVMSLLKNSEVTVLTVTEKQDEISGDDAEHGYDFHVQLQGLNHRFEVITSENVEQAITDYAHGNDMDIVMTIPRKASWFQRLIHPSVSKKLAQHLDIPVLTIS